METVPTTVETAVSAVVPASRTGGPRANEILKAAASFFAAELDRPHTRS
ncbi:hypothetical protein OG936_38285 (plasmid) [Streptomyces sp. NBC_00846]|nr:hypothetical protein OG936_38285 [Streptomyces sp. NBC_00846]